MPRLRTLAALTTLTLVASAMAAPMVTFTRCPPHGGALNHPPTQDQPIEITFLIDCSGQTTADGREKAGVVILQTLKKLRAQDSIKIAAFGNQVTHFTPGASNPHNFSRDAFEAWLKSHPSSGGTNIEAALTWAVKFRTPNGTRGLVVLLSDGKATLGERDAATLHELIKKRNVSGRAIAMADPEALTPNALYERVHGFLMSQRVEAIPAVPAPTPPNIDDIWADVFTPVPHPSPNAPICRPPSVPWNNGGHGPLNRRQIQSLEHYISVAQRVDVVPEHQDRRQVAPGYWVTPDVVVTHFNGAEFRRLMHELGPPRPGLAIFLNEIMVRVGRTTYLIRVWGC